jgi:acetoacetyl-CoA synthetase
LTGKKVEIAVKKILSGEKVVATSAIANPESLKLYEIAKSKL